LRERKVARSNKKRADPAEGGGGRVTWGECEKKKRQEYARLREKKNITGQVTFLKREMKPLEKKTKGENKAWGQSAQKRPCDKKKKSQAVNSTESASGNRNKEEE